MPLVVFSYPTEKLETCRAMETIEAIAGSLARNYTMKGYEQTILSFARCRLNPVPEGMRRLGGGPHPKAAQYEVEVDVPEGGLDAEGLQSFMSETAMIVIEAEGAPFTKENLDRVCCVVRDMPDGRWSIGTTTMTRRRIVKEAMRRQGCTRKRVAAE